MATSATRANAMSWSSGALWTVLLVLVTPALAETNSTASGWVPEPRGRGTWGLVFTCAFTLVLCAWTAVHDDINVNAQPSACLISKCFLMLVSLIAPELMILVAFGQWRRAKALHQVWCYHHGTSRGGLHDHLGMEGAFFAVMGGFTSGPADIDGQYPPSISVESFKALLRAEAISHSAVNKEEIVDKGKSDNIGKLLTLVQALSMVGQCIARKAASLPLTLLEIHVVTQVVCASVMYLFWWNKPLNVSKPIQLLRGSDMENVLAADYKLHENLMVGIIASGRRNPKETQAWRIYISGNVVSGTPTREISADSTYTFSGTPLSTIARPDNDKEHLYDPEEHPNTILPGESLVVEGNVVIKYHEDGSPKPQVTLDMADIARICGGAQAIRDSWLAYEPEKNTHGLFAKIKKIDLKIPGPLIQDTVRGSIRTILKGIEGASTQYDSAYKVIFFGSAMFMVVGALHCLGWNSAFPTAAEHALWRLSCLTLVAGPVAFGLIIIFMGMVDIVLDASTDHPNVRFGFYALTGALSLASLCLTIEGFISIRSVPIEAYQSAAWEDIWPHL